MNNKTVLIVEDEAIIAVDLAAKLVQLGYEIVGTAATGEDAIESALRLQPRVVLMDIRLKGRMDGIEAAKEIRSRLDVPVIYLTAHSDAATLERAKLSEPFGYILKPFEERELTTNIEMALHKHQSDSEKRLSQGAMRKALDELEQRTTELRTANESIRASRVAALNLMEDAVEARKKAEETSAELRDEIAERKKAEEEIKRHNAVLRGITAIFEEAFKSESDEALGRTCLRVAEELTGSKFGFIGELGADGMMHDTAISDPGWEACTMVDKTGHRRPPGDFKLHGIYGRVLLDGTSFFTNDPTSHSDSIGTPEGHPPLKAFLGVPLVHRGRTIGMISVGNRDGGYRQEDLDSLEALAPAIIEALYRVRAERALRENEERLNRSQEISHLGGWELDLGNNRLSWSDEVYRIFGLKPQEFGATYEAFLEAVHPDDREAVNAAYSSSLREGRDTYEIEHRVIRQDTGEIHIVHEKCTHFRDSSGRIIRSVGMVHDVTDRKKAEQDLLKLSEDMAARNVELESANKEMESFIYSISHDLRAPIRTMAGFAKILGEDYADKLDDQGKNYLARIEGGSGKATRLIDELLRLSKISRQDMDLIETDLSKKASSVIADLREASPGRNVDVEIKPGLKASADPRLIEVVLSNLLGNAWKFTSKTANARIEFGSTGQDGKTVYYVKDNGAGFDQALAEKMFWPFQRLHTAEEFEGTGIGLTIVERVVRRHGGRVWAEGEPGKGATVYFTLG